MKDQYVGDVNDFAKYQLLRLCEPLFERLIVAWMLTEADGRADGAQIGYLQDPGRGELDIELFRALGEIVSMDRRSVAAVEESGVLGEAAFHSEPMPTEREGRSRYFGALGDLANPGSLLFLDPDNGIEVASVTAGRRHSERYVYWEELAALAASGGSLLVYQHFPRVERRGYLDTLLARLDEECGGRRTFAAYTSQVAFLFAVNDERAAEVREVVIERCTDSPILSFVE
jgi:hypothetical protein